MADLPSTLTSPPDLRPTSRRRHVLHRVFPSEATVVLRPGDTAIGRATPDGQGFPDDPSMSRVHATVTLRDGTARVRDEGSHNGTFRRGVRVVEDPLDDGDLIRCGDSFFVYRIEPLDLDDAAVHGLMGRSPPMRRLRAELVRFGPTAVTPLLLGESGTGKTAAARTIHRLSGRRGEWVHVNGAAIPDNMAESLLFGHRAGAFTDARTDSPGWFRAAHRGTLFLDEVGLLTPATQARLLLAIENRAVVPLGTTTPVPVDVRLVVATNEDLDVALETGRFRPDLYARLAEVTLRLPPLRERREDVLPLLCAALGSAPPLTAGLVDRLLRWSWPFNVREVEKVAAELAIRGDGLPALGADLLDERFAVEAPAPRSSAVGGLGGPPDRDLLITLLQEGEGNVTRVAERVGRSTKQVYRWCAQHEVDPASFRS